MFVQNSFSTKMTIAAFSLFMIFLAGCAAGPSTSMQNGQLWRGKVSGDASGVIEVNVYKNPEQEGVYTVSGFIKADVVAGSAGPSKADLSINGKLIDGVLKGRLSGIVSAVSITTTAAGEVVGNMSATKGAGTYQARASEFGMRYRGKWVIECVQ